MGWWVSGSTESAGDARWIGKDHELLCTGEDCIWSSAAEMMSMSLAIAQHKHSEGLVFFLMLAIK